MTPAAATDVQAMVNLRAHWGSVTYELDVRKISVSLIAGQRSDLQTCIAGGHQVSEPCFR